MELTAGFSELFDDLYTGGAICMTIIIVLVIFSMAWLMYGVYNEFRIYCGGRDVRYPYCIVIAYHATLIVMPFVAVLVWGLSLDTSEECEVDWEESEPVVCLHDGPWVTFAVSIAHCVFLLTYLIYQTCRSDEPGAAEPAPPV